MQKVVIRILFLCLLGSTFYFVVPATAEAENKVHRKVEEQAVVAELFVTSW